MWTLGSWPHPGNKKKYEEKKNQEAPSQSPFPLRAPIKREDVDMEEDLLQALEVQEKVAFSWTEWPTESLEALEAD